MLDRGWKSFGLVAMACVGIACELPAAKAPEAPPPYVPEYKYPTPAAAEKLNITVGIVAPQFSGEGNTYWTMNKGQDDPKRMVSALKSSFSELLSAKGFNTTGPFDSVDNMTFPEKKGSDFVLYPEIDIQVKVKKVADAEPEKTSSSPFSLSMGPRAMPAAPGTQKCMVVASATGNIQLLVFEPLSKEKIWVKRLEVAVPDSPPALAKGMVCMGAPMAQQGDELGESWARTHVEIYKQVMQALDKYVNGEEFQTLKKQADELRAKKVY